MFENDRGDLPDAAGGLRPAGGLHTGGRLRSGRAAVRCGSGAAGLGIQSEWVLDQSFPQTARGVYLDYHAQMRGIARTAATKAVGTLRFSVERAPSTALSIAAGTACMTEGETRFQTTAEAVLAAGELSVDAPAEALEPGRSGNAAAGTIVILTACPVGITGCTNPAPFTGGSDQEDDASLRSRIWRAISGCPTGQRGLVRADRHGP